MNFKKTISFLSVIIFIISLVNISSILLFPLDPPTKEQIEKYKSDGTLEARIKQARSYGNHKISPFLINRLRERISGSTDNPGDNVLAPPPGRKGMPTTGNVKIPVLLLSFADVDNTNPTALMRDKIFGKGHSEEYPLESLKEFYLRSSFGKLNISGNILGWYKYPGSRSEIPETSTGQEDLIKEALLFYDKKGHDFSQYDNDNDGDIDYLVVIWSGEHGEWSSFWWAYQTSFYNSSFKIDGKSLSLYSWQWESYNYPNDEFSVSTLIHETGHALGLPDLYDYQEGIGPEGGVGGMDIMDAIWGDHNCFHKFMLDWTIPVIQSSGSAEYSFSPAVKDGESLLIMPAISEGSLFSEFFMIENRTRIGNDVDIPSDGLIIWHIDSTLDRTGRRFEYDNSSSLHKYVRLMEADGLEEIEQNLDANAGDFFTFNDNFGLATLPDSISYSGDNTGICIKEIFTSGENISFKALIDIPVTVELTGGRMQERAWIVVSDYGDFTFTFQKNREVDLNEFRIMRKYGKHDYEDLLQININEISGNSYSFKDPSLEKKAVYRYKVIAVDSSGNAIGISREVEI
ncbi:MAG: M6 family metalloprotease domain-containing protein [Candidatus Aminicenantes bacterium]|nr:M6 family metalloprotease domain-containing protein [Candidatus Aminicenantes bacterium]